MPSGYQLEAQPCRLAMATGSEEASLCVRDGVIFAILVRQTGAVPEEQGWYLQMGFGPCEGEGLIFTTIEEALGWVERSIAIG